MDIQRPSSKPHVRVERKKLRISNDKDLVNKLQLWQYDKIVRVKPADSVLVNHCRNERLGYHPPKVSHIWSKYLQYQGPVDSLEVCYRLPAFPEQDPTISKYMYGEEGSAASLSDIEVTVGPVIGMVTHTTARILVEVSNDCDAVTMALQAIGIDFQTSSHVVTKAVIKNRPVVFFFHGLAPRTYYKVHMNIQVPRLTNAGFWTVPLSVNLRQNHFYVACVSQNRPPMASGSAPNTVQHTDTWKSLYQLASRGLTSMIVHVGGAVLLSKSMDDSEKSPMERAMLLGRKSDPASEDDTEKACVEEEICDIFRDVYRKTWSSPFVRHTLANSPNIFIMSGEDVGIDPLLTTEELGAEQRALVIRCALQVYNEYQGSLVYDTVASVTHVDTFSDVKSKKQQDNEKEPLQKRGTSAILGINCVDKPAETTPSASRNAELDNLQRNTRNEGTAFVNARSTGTTNTSRNRQSSSASPMRPRSTAGPKRTNSVSHSASSVKLTAGETVPSESKRDTASVDNNNTDQQDRTSVVAEDDQDDAVNHNKVQLPLQDKLMTDTFPTSTSTVSTLTSASRLIHQTTATTFFRDKLLQKTPVAPPYYHHFHVLGDVGIVAVESLVVVLRPFLWNNLLSDVEETLKDIDAAFDPDKGIFRGCRFVFVIVPHMAASLVTDFTVKDLSRLRDAQSPTLLELGASVTRAVLQRARCWRGNSSLSTRQICVLSASPSGAAFEEIVWSEGDREADASMPPRPIFQVSIPPITLDPAPRRGKASAWFERTFRLSHAEKDDWQNVWSIKDKNLVQRTDSRGYLVMRIMGRYLNCGIPSAVQWARDYPLLPDFTVAVMPSTLEEAKNSSLCVFTTPPLLQESLC